MLNVKDWIKKHEGFNQFPYLDIRKKVTIGFGRNLDAVGISPIEANYLFDNDFENCIKELSEFPWYNKQPGHVQWALINMCFNMGIGHLCSFKKMIAYLSVNDYTRAAMEVLDSNWANQVGQRAKDVSLMMRQA